MDDITKLLESQYMSKEETNDLDYYREVRKQMVAGYIETNGGIPTDPKSMRLLNEIMMGGEGGIHTRASIRQRAVADQNQATLDKEMLATLLTSVGLNYNPENGKVDPNRKLNLDDTDEFEFNKEEFSDNPTIHVDTSDNGRFDFTKLQTDSWLGDEDEDDDSDSEDEEYEDDDGCEDDNEDEEEDDEKGTDVTIINT